MINLEIISLMIPAPAFIDKGGCRLYNVVELYLRCSSLDNNETVLRQQMA
jgi:hypothetical protein